MTAVRFGDLESARSAVTLAVTALAVVFVFGLVGAPSSTAGRASLTAGKPVITGVRGAVVAISAEGGTVAIHSRRSIANRTCDAVASWTPASGRITRFGAPRCAPGPDSDENDVALTLAGGHIAFVDYQFGNHAYCDGPYVAALTKPKPVSLHRCHPEDSDVYWEFFGGGGMLAARSYLQCNENCPPDYVGRYQTDVELWRLTSSGRLHRVIHATRNVRLLATDSTRLIVAGGGKPVSIVDIATGQATPTPVQRGSAAYLSGERLAVQAKRSVSFVDLKSEAVSSRLTLPRHAHLVGLSGDSLVYRSRSELHLTRVGTHRDRVVARIPYLAAAAVTAKGLFYGYNVRGGDSNAGRVAFRSWRALR